MKYNIAAVISIIIIALVITTWSLRWEKVDYIPRGNFNGVYSEQVANNFPHQSSNGVFFNANLVPLSEGHYESIGPYDLYLYCYAVDGFACQIKIDNISISGLNSSRNIIMGGGSQILSLSSRLAGGGGIGARHLVGMLEIATGIDENDLGSVVVLQMSSTITCQNGVEMEKEIVIYIDKKTTFGWIRLP